MKNNLELKWEDLKISYLNTDMHFNSTDEIERDESIIDQDHAITTLEFGLQLEGKGYNMYLSGVDEKMIFDYAKSRVEFKALGKKVPQDMCYIYNFENPSTPKVIWLKPGDGIHFKEDMKEFRQFLIDELGEKLDAEDAERKRQKLIDELDDKKEKILFDLKMNAKSLGFSVKMTKEGLGFVPLKEDGEALSMEAYENLDEEDKKQIQDDLEGLYDISTSILKEIKGVEKIYGQHLEDIDQEIVLREVGYFIKHLKDKYGSYKGIQEYLDLVLQDILENISAFSEEEQEEGQGIKSLFPWLSSKGVEEIVNRYNVNLLVDNRALKGAPVITSRNLSYGNLLGKIKIDTELNASHTDFNNIKAGLLHKAHGGYLLIYVNDLVDYPGAFEMIKRTLKTGEVMMEGLSGTGITTTIEMTPEPIAVDVKIILIGNYDVYSMLCEVDPTFKEFFKIHVDFKETIHSNERAFLSFAKQVKGICECENLPAVTKEGVVCLVEYAHRLAESQEKITANSAPIIDLLREANVFAKEKITKEDIMKARQVKSLFKLTVQQNIEEKYAKNIFMIEVVGRKAGQINGLAVYDIGDFSFGRPVRITATTYRGKNGVVDIESAVGLSGNIHAKGVQIITGFLGNQYAQDYPLSLCCKICFEQSYGRIDGDSASSAELYAVLSSLADVPIKQSIAVTGSINQYGEIQPIGGVNDKIEGFYRICKQKGITGKQGVMIPYQNKEDLVLEEEVIEAVKQGKFHIYLVKNYKEGMEILTGIPAKQIEERVQQKLKNYSIDKLEQEPKLERKKRK